MTLLARPRNAVAVFGAFALTAVFAFPAAARTARTPAPDWSRLSFFLGEWAGDGSFAFSLELEGRVIVLRTRTEVPAADGRPASARESLMVIHKQPGLPEKAVDFDSDGRFVEYVASLSMDGSTLTFLSGWDFSAPIYRLSYAKAGADTLAVKFETAPADSPSDFQTAFDGRARRRT